MPAEAEGGVIRLVVPSDPFAVREALRRLFAEGQLGSLPETDRGTAELVLAEVLNNIVEHAYAQHHGVIEVTVRQEGRSLVCMIVDRGGLMPGGRLPEAHLGPPENGNSLPEGGFGWPLIRALATDLAYRRIGDRNELTFRLEYEQ